MRIIDGFHAFRSGNQYQCFDIAATFSFQQVDGRNHRAAGRQHRVDNQGRTLGHAVNEFLKVRNRFQRFFIALQADNADFSGRNQVEYAVEHTQTGTQNRDNGQGFAFDTVAFDRATPTVDDVFFGFKVAAGFVCHQACQLGSERAEFVGAAFCLAHQSQFVADEGMIDDGNVHFLYFRVSLTE